MTDTTMRGFVRAFCDALLTHDPEKIAPWIDDDVDWLVFGPIDLFPFFGQRSGRDAVVTMWREVAEALTFRQCDKDSLLVEGDKASALIRVTAVHKKTGRTLSLRFAQFVQFRDGKVTRLRAVFDSFDAVEQALGREIDLSAAALQPEGGQRRPPRIGCGTSRCGCRKSIAIAQGKTVKRSHSRAPMAFASKALKEKAA
jgi:ketosteroid isomerase-like protein